MAGEKTERASPRRKQQARERGDIFQSRELTGAMGMAAGVLAMSAMVVRFAVGWRAAYLRSLDFGIHRDMSLRDGAVMNELVHVSAMQTAIPVAVILGATLVAAAITAIAQSGGVRFHGEPMQLNFERILPANNLKNIFSMRAATRMFKSLIPAALVMVLGADVLEHSVLSMPVLSLAQLPVLFQSQYRLLLATSGILLCWSALDYLVEWRSWEQRLRMSREEMRQEYKDMEGNPQIRSRIRSIQRQMRRRKIQADVSRATVVIANPTHYAVALEFDFETLQAPKVLTKGRNLMAEQIKDEARWAGVPIVENPPLARSLYRSVEPGQAIPHDLYAAVASILAFLYRQRMDERRQRDRRRQETKPAGSAEQPVRRTTGTAQYADRPARHRLGSGTSRRTGPEIKNSSEIAEEFGMADAAASPAEPAAKEPGEKEPGDEGS